MEKGEEHWVVILDSRILEMHECTLYLLLCRGRNAESADAGKYSDVHCMARIKNQATRIKILFLFKEIDLKRISPCFLPIVNSYRIYCGKYSEDNGG